MNAFLILAKVPKQTILLMKKLEKYLTLKAIGRSKHLLENKHDWSTPGEAMVRKGGLKTETFLANRMDQVRPVKIRMNPGHELYLSETQSVPMKSSTIEV